MVDLLLLFFKTSLKISFSEVSLKIATKKIYLNHLKFAHDDYFTKKYYIFSCSR